LKNVFIGKIFWNSELIFEGELKNDKMHGQGNKNNLFID